MQVKKINIWAATHYQSNWCFGEGVAPKAKVRNSGGMVLPDASKLLQIRKLKKQEPLNAGEKFINSKKKKKCDDDCQNS